MTRADDRILEFRDNDPNEEFVAYPMIRSENLDFTRQYVTERMKVFRDVELVEYHEQKSGISRTSHPIMKYLREDIDAERLETDGE